MTTQYTFLHNTVWKWTCEACEDPKVAWLELRPDGVFGWSYEGPSKFKLRGSIGRTLWSMQDGQLVINWNDGYSIERYRLRGPLDTILSGTKSNLPGARITLEKLW